MVNTITASGLMAQRGQRLFSLTQQKLGLDVAGPITFSDQTRRYTRVHKDPDLIFADPEIKWQPEPPKYDFWLGVRELDQQRVSRAFDYALGHEIIEVAEEVCRFSLARKLLEMPHQTIKPIDELSQRLAAEIARDRGALQLGGRIGLGVSTTQAMVGFSLLVLRDYQEGALPNIGLSSAAREMAKLTWVKGQEALPHELRQEAGNLLEEYFAALAISTSRWSQQAADFTDLLEAYLAVFGGTRMVTLV